jgi:hypothetical protein
MKLNNKYLWINEINQTWQSTLLPKKSYDQLSKMLKMESPCRNLLYRASRDGFQNESFHINCDNQSCTICLVKSEFGQIFVGFAEPSWNSKNQDICKSGKFFIFQLDFDTKHEFVEGREIYGGNQWGIVFGSGIDIAICDNSKQNRVIHCQLGKSYKLEN